MSNASTERKNRPVRRQRSILYQFLYGLPKQQPAEMATPLPHPTGDVRAYALQVGGHMKTEDNKYLGEYCVLQCNNGTILKPIIKETQQREVEFYTRLQNTNAPDLKELRSFVPKYYGCRKFTYNGYEQDYIVLENLNERMLEPCIMDVKIGKRTWDPNATEEKIRNEQTKYAACKQQYGFCIPGYQVHELATGKLHKYGKDHGKKLKGAMVIAAIKKFLNGVGGRLCRALVLQFLSELWRVQAWAAQRHRARLYSASLLLIYDAAKLRECCGEPDNKFLTKCRPQQPVVRRQSFHAPDSGSNFSGQLTSKGPLYKKVNSVPITSMSLAHTSFSQHASIHSPWTDALEKMNQHHSFEHNYEDKLCKIKMNYRAVLDQLSDDSPHNPWGTVKIIDFAHAFFNDDEEMAVDENFKEGIDNFVAIFEQFLRETNDQVF